MLRNCGDACCMVSTHWFAHWFAMHASVLSCRSAVEHLWDQITGRPKPPCSDESPFGAPQPTATAVATLHPSSHLPMPGVTNDFQRHVLMNPGQRIGYQQPIDSTVHFNEGGPPCRARSR